MKALSTQEDRRLEVILPYRSFLKRNASFRPETTRTLTFVRVSALEPTLLTLILQNSDIDFGMGNSMANGDVKITSTFVETGVLAF